MKKSCKYSVADCDVEDKETLQDYREKRKEWLSWLQHDESHAIMSLIHAMAWNDVSFRFLARMAENDASSPLRNTLVAEALIDGHFATQVLAIRRLTDDRKDVISLRRLIADLKMNRHLLTRENYVSHDGWPYDHEAAQERVRISHEGTGAYWVAQTGPEAYFMAERAHASFDRLVGGTPETRTRTERIPLAHLDRLSESLNDPCIEQLVKWSHKFLAHGADQQSRQKIDLSKAQPTLARITESIRCLSRVTQEISQTMLFGNGFGSLVPVAQFDLYEFLTVTPLPEKEREELGLYWDKLVRERNAFIDD